MQEFLLRYAREKGFSKFQEVHEKIKGQQLHDFYLSAFNSYLDSERKPTLVDKLSSKWVSSKERLPNISFNTIIYKGGHPEPTINCFYSDEKWWKSDTHEEINLPFDFCWLEDINSDYPHVKF